MGREGLSREKGVYNLLGQETALYCCTLVEQHDRRSFDEQQQAKPAISEVFF